MDCNSWLWRNKSSEKSPSKTESSGSISSHSEQYSDDQATFKITLEVPFELMALSNMTVVEERRNGHLKTVSYQE